MATNVGFWMAGTVLTLVGMSLPLHARADEGAAVFYFTASPLPEDSRKCEKKVLSQKAFVDSLQQAFAQTHWVEMTRFQGRLGDVIGVEMIERAKTDDGLVLTWVIAGSLESCERAAVVFDEVRTAIEATRLPKLSKDIPPASTKGQGRRIFEMACHQKMTRSGLTTTCTSRKVCKRIKVKSTDPMMPLDLTLKCASTELTVE